MRIAISSAFVFLIFHVVHPVSSQVLQFEKTPFFSYNAKDCSSAATCFNRKPVVMVPGILGARLNAKLNKPNVVSSACDKKADWYSLWLNLEQLFPPAVDCWVDNMKLMYNNITRKVRNNDGVRIRVPNFSSTEAFEYLDENYYAPGSKYFAPLVEHFVKKLGYTRQKDLWGAAYDWRLSPKQHTLFLKNLTKIVEKVYHLNDNRKVLVLGHSMGSTFIYYWLMQQSLAWKDKYIDSFVSISGPYLGSVKAIKAVVSGETEGHDYVLPRLKLRDAVRTGPAFVFALPRPDLWPSDKRTVVVTSTQNYTVDDYKTLLKRSGCQWCYQMWVDNGMILGSLDPPSVAVHCIYSSQVGTPEVLLYDSVDPNFFPNGIPGTVDGSGDATVNVWSSSACLRWRDQQKQAVHNIEMPGNTHVQILWNSTLHKYLDGVVLSN